MKTSATSRSFQTVRNWKTATHAGSALPAATRRRRAPGTRPRSPDQPEVALEPQQRRPRDQRRHDQQRDDQPVPHVGAGHPHEGQRVRGERGRSTGSATAGNVTAMLLRYAEAIPPVHADR
jgi:hypothetical protein